MAIKVLAKKTHKLEDEDPNEDLEKDESVKSPELVCISDDDDEIPTEYLLSRQMCNDLAQESFRLNSLSIMNYIDKKNLNIRREILEVCLDLKVPQPLF